MNAIERDFARIEPGQRQERLDQRAHPQGRAAARLDRLAQLFGRPLLVEGQLRVREDHRHGVRSSCDASAVKRTCCEKADSIRSNIWLSVRARPSAPFRSP